MLPVKNNTISILSFVPVAGSSVKRNWTTVSTGVRVYINQIQEDLVPGFDGSGSFLAYRMLTDGNHAEILINDRITDKDSNEYTVKGKSTFSDLTGKHHQYLMIIPQD